MCKFILFFELPFFKHCHFNSSDGRVVKASVSEAVDLGFDSESDQTNNFKIGIHSFPASRSTLKG